MSLETIWAPWRLDYIAKDEKEESQVEQPEKRVQPKSDCFLCDYRQQPQNDKKNHVLLRGEKTFIVFNRFPYNNGHLLIAPQEHLGDLTEIPVDVQAECQAMLVKMVEVLRKVVHPDGFNIGLNLGLVAGAGLPGHLHWHIVPRWNGDANFMPVLANTKVIPQSLEALYELLEKELTGKHA
ncbi:HIT family protein [Rubinisphaera italica]|uniref:AP-4-A phosphorylase n=1 Tax=Rubinisphaera italica TaxID=2527969 RepID=A0A5C5XNK6_9PLAN|nr:HIT domain-containing protein [Rubinisphaera italica]TWT63665.1 AP-4-A phosphorylase [Rubinisphaera italica]